MYLDPTLCHLDWTLGAQILLYAAPPRTPRLGPALLQTPVPSRVQGLLSSVQGSPQIWKFVSRGVAINVTTTPLLPHVHPCVEPCSIGKDLAQS